MLCNNIFQKKKSLKLLLHEGIEKLGHSKTVKIRFHFFGLNNNLQKTMGKIHKRANLNDFGNCRPEHL